jgi:hypothetical protein
LKDVDCEDGTVRDGRQQQLPNPLLMIYICWQFQRCGVLTSASRFNQQVVWASSVLGLLSTPHLSPVLLWIRGEGLFMAFSYSLK